MTEVNGLHLAFRGLVAGLAGGWVWLAIALGGLRMADVDPLGATAFLGNGTLGSGLIGSLAVAQLVTGGIGMLFAYFFARYFTVRATLAIAATAFALLAWLALSKLLDGSWLTVTRYAVLTIAAMAYGLMLGGAVPVRGEVLRHPPATHPKRRLTRGSAT
jgi:hypothetical protein